MLKAVTDILLDEEPRIDALRVAAARSFEIDVRTVAAGPLLQLNPTSGTVVLLQRQPEDMPGDFPVWFGLAVDATLVDRVPRALDAIARSLGIVLLTDAEDDEEMTLHLPDGTHQTVRLTQDEDDAFRINPEMQHLINRAARHTHPSKAIAG